MAKIEILSPFILSWEGKFCNVKGDRGGATMMGVTMATWKRVGYDKTGDGVIDVEDLKKLSKADVVDRVMKPHYWDKCKASRIKSQSVANILVDWYWSSGSCASRALQRILGVTVDGVIGEQTLAAINKANPMELFANIKRTRIQFIQNLVNNNPSQEKFKTGWMRRISYINYGSLQYNSAGTNVVRFQDI